MEKILNQEEIDGLFRAAQRSGPKATPAKRRVVQPCDFRQAGQLTKSQVRHVTLLHENFAPNLAGSLGAYLRVGVQISLVSVEQLAYAEFLARLPGLTYFATSLLMPLEESAAIQMDLSLVFPMIDLLLGGPGLSLAEPRDLTEIEEQIMESVVAVLCRELQSTWQLVLPIEFRVGPRLKQSQIMTLLSAGERVLNVSFEMHLNEIRGVLNLIFPAVVSNTFLRKLSQEGMVQHRKTSADSAARLRQRLLESTFTVELNLPRVVVRIRDIVDLQPDRILPLRHSVNEPMCVSVSGRSVFGGVPVGCGPVRGALVQGRLPMPERDEKGRS